MSSGPHQLAPEGPARPSRPRLGQMDPSSPIDSYFHPFSMHAIISFYLLLATYTRTDTASKEVARKVSPLWTRLWICSFVCRADYVE